MVQKTRSGNGAQTGAMEYLSLQEHENGVLIPQVDKYVWLRWMETIGVGQMQNKIYTQ